MSEMLRKRLSYGLAGMLALGAYAVRAETNDATDDMRVKPMDTKSTVTYFNPDLLQPCRLQDTVIDQDCAFEQTVAYIETDDHVMAGVWAYHITRPDLSFELDILELDQAHHSAKTGNAGECAMWASRVLDEHVYVQIPECY